jgi:hypothetical protein
MSTQRLIRPIESNRIVSRRGFVRCGIALSVAAAFERSATGVINAAEREKPMLCADPKAIDSTQASMRTSLNYTDVSKDAAKTCSVCAFFQPTADDCGTCQILSGPANPKGHCDSWSAKE